LISQLHKLEQFNLENSVVFCFPVEFDELLPRQLGHRRSAGVDHLLAADSLVGHHQNLLVQRRRMQDHNVLTGTQGQLP